MDAPILRLDQYDRGRPSAGVQVTLEITRGKAHQRLRPVSGRVFLIGTANDCDLVLGDLSFPEVYAYLFVEGAKVSIRRLGAGPPLFVCGERLDRAELFQRDVVQFGPFELRLDIGLPVGPPHAAAYSSDFDESDESDSAAVPAVLRFSPPSHCSP